MSDELDGMHERLIAIQNKVKDDISKQLKAADELAKAAEYHLQCPVTNCRICDALAAYEKVRGMK